jgi:hypothetical protein
MPRVPRVPPPVDAQSPDYNDLENLSTLDVLRRERLNAIGPVETIPVSWRMFGDVEKRLDDLITNLHSLSRDDLRVLPRLKLPRGTLSVDIGGVFRDRVNGVFEHLLASDIFIQEVGAVYSDAGITLRGFEDNDEQDYYDRERYYRLLGTIIYWFIFIHHLVPYPMRVDPTIIAYCIKREIRLTVVEQVKQGLRRCANTIRTYNRNTKMSAEVREWIESSNEGMEAFKATLRTEGPEKAAQNLCNKIILASFRVCPGRLYQRGE